MFYNCESTLIIYKLSSVNCCSVFDIPIVEPPTHYQKCCERYFIDYLIEKTCFCKPVPGVCNYLKLIKMSDKRKSIELIFD